VFFDGGARPNPGRIEAAVVVRGVVHVLDGLGLGTNRDAEWLALIGAMTLVQALGLTDVVLIGDAAEVVLQANKALRSARALPCALPCAMSPAVPPHAATFLALAAKGPPVRIRWIKRAQNLAGIALAARHPR